jgi:hypothetical protein
LDDEVSLAKDGGADFTEREEQISCLVEFT